MPEPIVTPSPQFCDANGVPYAGGTLTTYVPGTDTLANTWTDLGGTALNANPIVLDAAGRCLIYGSGEYRLVLKDANGNLIWDQVSTSYISDAMKTVVQADSVATAADLLGITDHVATETDRATSAESSLTLDLNAEISRATAAENTLNDLIHTLASQQGPSGTIGAPGSGTTGAYFIQDGISGTDSSGFITVTFPRAYTVNPGVWIQVIDSAFTNIAASISYTTTTQVGVFINSAGAPQAAAFIWIAFGY